MNDINTIHDNIQQGINKESLKELAEKLKMQDENVSLSDVLDTIIDIIESLCDLIDAQSQQLADAIKPIKVGDGTEYPINSDFDSLGPLEGNILLYDGHLYYPTYYPDYFQPGSCSTVWVDYLYVANDNSVDAYHLLVGVVVDDHVQLLYEEL